MNPLVNVDVTLYFEVSNSVMFGGEGTVGYTSTSFGEVKKLEIFEDESIIESQKKTVAEMLRVTTNNVKLISKEEYKLATEEDSDDYDFNDEEDYV